MLTDRDLPAISWRTLYNSNLDKAPKQRRPRKDLQKDLQEWEAGQKGRKSHKLPDEDLPMHELKHNAQFKDLIAKAAKGKPIIVPDSP